MNLRDLFFAMGLGNSGGAVSPEQIDQAVNDYLDKNPVGVDLAMTGAAVGQIAKITAVDDSGVPTAWEPVDLPSGEKEWKLIRAVVLDEDVQLVSITTDEDGNPFAFDELAIRSVTMEGEDGKNQHSAAVWINDTDYTKHAPDNSVYFGFRGRHTTGYFSPSVIRLYPFCGHFVLSAAYHDAGVDSATFLEQENTTFDEVASKNSTYSANTIKPTTINTADLVNGYHLMNSTKRATKITAFSYGAPYADHLMAAGSIFEFYGR